MVEFGSGRYMPMDRGYVDDMGADHGFPGSATNSEQITNDAGVGIGDIGVSLGLGPVPNIPAVSAKIRAGSKTMELGFMGMGKGSGQGHTPEMYGKVQRQALREIQTANRVDFTTHSSVGVMGLAGMDQQGNFNRQSKKQAVDEIRRAVDFAADVSQGGPVVVHTGEFFRPFVDATWNKDQNFKMYDDEEGRASFRVIDRRTGRVIEEARKNRKVARPIWNTAEKGKEYIDNGVTKIADSQYDENGRLIYVDYYGKRISDEDRVPKFNPDTGIFEVRQLTWDDLVKESEQMTKRAQEVWRAWKEKGGKESDKDFEKSYWGRFKNAKSVGEIKVRPEEAYIISTLETNAANSRGWAYYYGGSFDEHIENMIKLRKAYDFYKKIEDETDEDEKWRLKRQAGSRFGDLVPEDAKFPSKIIERLMRDEDRQINQSKEASASQWAQAEESKETIRNVESAETYALRESFDSYAEAGISAMKQSQRLEKEGKLKKPVQVAMENLFPESYGAHPDELITLVEGGRRRMAEMLVQQGLSEEQATKRAQDHITATFDTGHFNMWRKYWNSDPKKSIEENDKNFNKWMLGKVEELAEKNIVGHLHLVDNYGYQDDHLAPGEGNTPIKDMVKIFKKHGYKGEMIVEPGADYTTDVSGFHSVMKTWKMFGSSVYGSGSGGTQRGSWGQVQNSYFGQTQPPYFTFGAYGPSEDWTLWSGVPLE
ncbi:hypothetical protein COV17_03375 [Candidatus Woesearchaeota archaeon CG10_big_fil_rev_8_21_14_0_10_36_11]|nr:MAG: hypothetical protein COV17_03375 [Candidatus Woesearchaeota archaeon CG10_big_fil_rev_8_21_14_0_10_36_11]